MARSTLTAWHPESEFRALIEQVAAYLNSPGTERKLLMALQADVQKLISDIAANSSLAKSAAAAQAAIASQVADLKAQVTALQAGQVLSAEDLTAIQGGVATLEETNAALATAVPAATPPETSAADAPAQ